MEGARYGGHMENVSCNEGLIGGKVRVYLGIYDM